MKKSNLDVSYQFNAFELWIIKIIAFLSTLNSFNDMTFLSTSCVLNFTKLKMNFSHVSVQNLNKTKKIVSHKT